MSRPHWLPREVGGLPAGAAEPSAYWFSEGSPTRGLAQSGPRGASPISKATSPRSATGQWSASAPQPSPTRAHGGYGRRPELRQLPYRRGLALALLWDSRLRAATDGRVGVDDVLMAMRKRAKTGSRTADQLFPLVYRELGGPTSALTSRPMCVTAAPSLCRPTLRRMHTLRAARRGAAGIGARPDHRRRAADPPPRHDARRRGECRRLMIGG
jgi:hypothetical protein